MNRTKLRHLIRDESEDEAARFNKFKNVSILIQKVQSFASNPFKLNELLTIEKHLREVTLKNPKIDHLVGKLANESVFVNPARKQKYLARSLAEKRSDLATLKQVAVVHEQIKQLNCKIDYYKGKYDRIKATENDTIRETTESKVEYKLLEENFLKRSKDFELLYDYVISQSTRRSNAIKFKIPSFLESIGQCEFMQQLNSLVLDHRNFLIRIALGNSDKQQVYIIKRNWIKHLSNYLVNIKRLSDIISLIEDAYSSEIPDEIESIRRIQEAVQRKL